MKNPPNIAIDPVQLQAAQILNRAADLLVKEGWRTSLVGRPREPKCVLGAINMVHNGSTLHFSYKKPEWLAAITLLATALDYAPCPAIDQAWNVAGWNNEQTDGQVVIDKLREVAKSLVHA